MAIIQSFKVKSGYIEQLRNLDLIAVNFIPLFLALLHLEGGLAKAFKLDIWAVNEFYVDRKFCYVVDNRLLKSAIQCLSPDPSAYPSWLLISIIVHCYQFRLLSIRGFRIAKIDSYRQQ